MSLLFRTVAWLLTASIAFAALGPARWRPRLWITHLGEHALAFSLLGAAFALAYPRHRSLVAIILVGSTAVFEILQLLTPERHARLKDFLVDATAALLGIALVVVLERVRRAIG